MRNAPQTKKIFFSGEVANSQSSHVREMQSRASSNHHSFFIGPPLGYVMFHFTLTQLRIYKWTGIE